MSVPEGWFAGLSYLAERYITDRYLPDKAIDLLDEACTHASLRNPAITEYEDAARRLTA